MCLRMWQLCVYLFTGQVTTAYLVVDCICTLDGEWYSNGVFSKVTDCMSI